MKVITPTRIFGVFELSDVEDGQLLASGSWEAVNAAARLFKLENKYECNIEHENSERNSKGT